MKNFVELSQKRRSLAE